MKKNIFFYALVVAAGFLFGLAVASVFLKTF